MVYCEGFYTESLLPPPSKSIPLPHKRIFLSLWVNNESIYFYRSLRYYFYFYDYDDRCLYIVEYFVHPGYKLIVTLTQYINLYHNYICITFCDLINISFHFVSFLVFFDVLQEKILENLIFLQIYYILYPCLKKKRYGNSTGCHASQT
jgi:hypothetical protein